MELVITSTIFPLSTQIPDAVTFTSCADAVPDISVWNPTTATTIRNRPAVFLNIAFSSVQVDSLNGEHTLGQTFEGNFGRREVGAEKNNDMIDTWRWQAQNSFL
jgi:hypothetical protein